MIWIIKYYNFKIYLIIIIFILNIFYIVLYTFFGNILITIKLYM